MLSIALLPVFIVLVCVSGSAIKDIETSSISTLLFKESGKAFIKTNLLATTLTTPLVTTEPSTIVTLQSFAVPTIPSRSVDSKSLTTSTSEETKAAITTNGYLNITSQAGTHAYLPCNVKQLVKKPISWVRVRDGHILTVDDTTFISDQRFQSIYTENPERWSLKIKFVQRKDAGSYECHVSTEPKTSARVSLSIVEPKTELIGESNRHVKAGSRVILRCVVSGALEPPLFINWYFDRKQIFLHNHKGWQTEIDRDSSDNHSDKLSTIASLIIPFVTKKDSGNYTCSPSNSEPVTVVLHVLNGEYSASAIMSRSKRLQPYLKSLITIVCLCFLQ